jgi:hypothetical protein
MNVRWIDVPTQQIANQPSADQEKDGWLAICWVGIKKPQSDKGGSLWGWVGVGKWENLHQVYLVFEFSFYYITQSFPLTPIDWVSISFCVP